MRNRESRSGRRAPETEPALSRQPARSPAGVHPAGGKWRQCPAHSVRSGQSRVAWIGREARTASPRRSGRLIRPTGPTQARAPGAARRKQVLRQSAEGSTRLVARRADRDNEARDLRRVERRPPADARSCRGSAGIRRCCSGLPECLRLTIRCADAGSRATRRMVSRYSCGSDTGQLDPKRRHPGILTELSATAKRAGICRPRPVRSASADGRAPRESGGRARGCLRATDEQSRRYRQGLSNRGTAYWARLGISEWGGPRPGRDRERHTVGSDEDERIGQHANCFEVRPQLDAALQVAHCPRADPGTLCQRLLGQRGSDPVLPEEDSKLLDVRLSRRVHWHSRLFCNAVTNGGCLHPTILRTPSQCNRGQQGA